jgi:hypothetical protein
LSACSWAPAPGISRTPGWIGWSVQAERKHTNNYVLHVLDYIYNLYQ